MKSIPVNTSDLVFMAISVDPKVSRDGEQISRKLDSGEVVPQWMVQTVVTGPYGRPEVIGVTVTSKVAPSLVAGQPCQFDRLVARSYEMATSREGTEAVEKRAGITFSADFARPANAPKASPVKPEPATAGASA